MKKLVHYFESEKGNRVKNSLVCFGAAVVLAGALFKIMHWPGAGAMLTAGMLTEVFLFAMFGLLPPHKDYYWEKMYPGLDVHPDHDPSFEHEAPGEPKKGITQQLDSMLESADVQPALIEKLGDSIRKFSSQTEGMADVTDALAATSEYSEGVRQASGAMSEMRAAYNGATEAFAELSASAEGTRAYNQEISKVASNLTNLNSMYEVELQDTSTHLKSINGFFGNFSSNMENMSSAMTNTADALSASAQDAQQFQNEMAGFNKNLSALNSVYGNMLSAMGVGANQNA